MGELVQRHAPHGIAVRPHAKPCKSLEFARLQNTADACGLTVAKVGEAETLLPSFSNRTPDVLVGYPVVNQVRAEQLAGLARTAAVRVALDSAFALDAVEAAARSQPVRDSYLWCYASQVLMHAGGGDDRGRI